MAHFIYVRHGQSQANLDGTIGMPETLLTKEGIEQAHSTGRDLAGKGVMIIASSPFTRTRQTAEVIAAELSILEGHIKLIDSLHERRMGDYEGKLKDHESEWYILDDEPGMEQPASVLKRMHIALKEIRKLSEEGLVLVVGHAATGFYLVQAAKGIYDVKDFPPPAQMVNAGYMEIEL
ncbi:hypothetical protein BH10PAT3_BH10PAT3_6890 [soil metagenome]